MQRRSPPEKAGAAGFLVVDKPAGWTSHDVVDVARRWFGTRRVGHLGTLDPLATGVLPLAVREATKLVPFVADAPKEYRATFRLGVETDTLDADGRELRRHEGPPPDEKAVRMALLGFLGEQLQVPPMFSALKQQGRALHRLAREGVEVERAPRRITVERLECIAYRFPELEVEIRCSPGTYVRSLASDLGLRLGCGAHVSALRRTRSGPFRLAQAATREQLEEEAAGGTLERRLLTATGVLDLGELRLAAEDTRRVRAGARLDGRLAAGAVPGARFAALDEGGGLVAVLELREDGWLRPLRVLRPIS